MKCSSYIWSRNESSIVIARAARAPIPTQWIPGTTSVPMTYLHIHKSNSNDKLARYPQWKREIKPVTFYTGCKLVE